MQINKSLIQSCISQNREAQKQLYRLLLPYLRAIASRYLRDTSYIKDVLQESYIKIFKSIDKYDFNKAPFQQWAAKITINSCINYNKRVIGTPNEKLVVEKHETGMMPTVIQNWSDENLLLVLKQMPAGYFEVFNLFIIDGYTHEEIAKILGISEALSRKRLSRARKWLKKNFQANHEKIEQFKFSSFPLN